MYYEGIHEIESIEGVYFKIKKIKPTKLFTYQTLLGNVFGDASNKSNDEVTLEKCYNFILENTLFSREKDGKFVEIQMPGLDNTNLKEVDENPTIIGAIVAMFMNNVVIKVEKK